MCLQGTSPIDTINLRRQAVRRGMLAGICIKTRVDFHVKLDPVAAEILVRHNFNLRFVEQPFNEAIKKMMVTIFELYRPHFEEEFEEPYELIYFQQKNRGYEKHLSYRHKGFSRRP